MINQLVDFTKFLGLITLIVIMIIIILSVIETFIENTIKRIEMTKLYKSATKEVLEELISDKKTTKKR